MLLTNEMRIALLHPRQIDQSRQARAWKCRVASAPFTMALSYFSAVLCCRREITHVDMGGQIRAKKQSSMP